MAVERLLPAIALFTCSYFENVTIQRRPKKYKYATKVKMPDIIQPITIFPQFGWVRRLENGIACIRTASLPREPTKTSKPEEKAAPCMNTGESS